MNPNACVIDVVEQAYQISRSEEAWIQGLLHALRPVLDRGEGLLGGIYDVSDPNDIRIRAASGVGASLELVRLLSNLPKRTPAQLVQLVFRTKPFATTSEKLRKHGGFEGSVGRFTHVLGITDVIDLNAQNPSGHGVMIGAPLRSRVRLTTAEISRGAHLAAHIAAAFRLREQLVGKCDPIAGADAILRPDTQVQHASEEAKSAASLMTLRNAAKALDRARGELRRHDPGEALALWKALISGRWTLFDHYESDGRRILIARRNDPEIAPRANLLPRTCQVLAYRAMGHSLKVIAYELGLSKSTVHREIERGMAALGLCSVVELARLKSDEMPAKVTMD